MIKKLISIATTLGACSVARDEVQSIPPSWPDQRFRSAQGDSGKRLHYLASHLNVDGTPIQDWKLLVGSATAPDGCLP